MPAKTPISAKPVGGTRRLLKARAALSGLSLSDYLIREVRKIAENPTPEEMRERLRQRDPHKGKISPTEIVRSERDSR